MIPIRDRDYQGYSALISSGLIGIIFIIFVTEVHLNVLGELRDWIGYWAIVPSEIMSLFTEAIATGNPATWVFLLWRLFCLLPATFLQSSYGQVLGNLIFLFVFSQRLEQKLGRWQFLGFYLCSSWITSLIRVMVDPDIELPIIGANGAIAALLGAYVILFPKAKIESLLPLVISFIPLELPVFFYLFWWFIQQLFYGIGSFPLPANPMTSGYWLQQILAIAWGIVVAYLWQTAGNHKNSPAKFPLNQGE